VVSGLEAVQSVAGSLSLSGGRSLAATPATGTLTNTGSIDLAPGSTLTVTGNLTQTGSGLLRCSVLDPATFGRLIVSGSAVLAGTLSVNLVSPYTLPYSTALNFLQAQFISGSFAAIYLPGLSTPMKWAALYEPGAFWFILRTGIPGRR
jgi:hypothetical protein